MPLIQLHSVKYRGNKMLLSLKYVTVMSGTVCAFVEKRLLNVFILKHSFTRVLRTECSRFYLAKEFFPFTFNI